MKRILSVLLVLAMLVSYVPTYAVAEETTVEDASAVSADEVEKTEAETVADGVEPDETEATDATEVASEATEETTETIPESTTGISETIGTSPTEEKNADKPFVFLNADFQEEDQTYHYTVEANVGDIMVLCADLEYNGEKPLQYQWMRFDIDRNAYIDISLEENEDARSEKLTVNVTEAMIEMEAPFACMVTSDMAEGLAVFSLVQLETENVESFEATTSSVFSPLWPLKQSYYIGALDTYPGGTKHGGIDIINDGHPTQDVFAVYDGTVVSVYNGCSHHNNAPNDTCGQSWGNNIQLKHIVNGQTYYSRYAHLTQNSIVVKVGDSVGAGEKIAKMGSSGNSTAPHLHLEITPSQYPSKDIRGQSFDYYINNTDLLSSSRMGFSTKLAVNSPRYGTWIQNNCKKESNGYYYSGGTSSITAPSAPTNFKAVYVDNERAKLSWSASSGATSYEVQYWSVGSNAWKTDTSYGSGTSYTSTGLRNYSSWTFRVRAVNSAGKSDWVSCNYEKTHTHSYKQEFEAAHPHKVYMKCSSCGDWYYTGATTTVDSCTQCHPPVQQVYLDLKGYLDGRDSDSLENFGTCDVYINDVKVADDCTDFYRAYPVGTKYSIKDIRATDGHKYIGEKPFVDEDGNTSIRFEDDDGTISGTLKKNTEVVLEFETTSHGGKCGDNLTWILDGNGVLTISGSGPMTDYSSDGSQSTAPWAAYSPKKLVLNNGITRIGDYAFFQCHSLTGSLTLPESLESIGDSAFLACSGITGSLILPSGMSSIGNSAFCRCTGFSGGLILPNGIVNIGEYAFTWCSGFTGALTLPNELLRIGEFAFYGCTGFTDDLILPEKLTSIGASAFYGCTGFGNDLWIPESVTSIGSSAFRNCTNLKTASILCRLTDIYSSSLGYNDDGKIPGFTIQGFAYSTAQSYARQRGFDFTLIEETVLQSGTCGDDLTWSFNTAGTLTITGTGAMWNYEWCQDGDTVYSSAPWAGLEITDIALDEGVTRIGNCAFLDCKTIFAPLSLPSTLQEIGDAAFSGCYGLYGELELPESIIAIGACAFQGCEGLTGALNLPSGISYIGSAVFNGCSGLTGTISIPKNVQYIGDWAFRDCIGFTGKLVVPSNVIVIDEYAFAGCAGIEQAEIPADLQLIGEGAFEDCASLADVYYAGSLTQWNQISIGANNAPLLNATLHCTDSDDIDPRPLAQSVTLWLDGEAAPKSTTIDLNDYPHEKPQLSLTATVLPEEAVQSVTWSSSAPKVATVEEDGRVTVVSPGTAVIKAIATDGSKKTAQISLNVIRTDRSPRLGTSTLTLNGVSTAGVQVDLVETYGNRIQNVRVDDDRLGAEYEDNVLTLYAREAIAKGTCKVVLTADTDGGTYTYPLTIKVTQALPKLTVKQSNKFDLFYRDSESTLTITGGEVESAAFIGSSDFALENEDDQWFIRYTDPENIPAKPGTKVTLSVLFAGYNAPVTKSVTIATVNTAPKLKLSPASSVLNTVLTEALEVRAQLAGTDDDNLSVWTDTPGAEVYLDDGTLTIELSAAKAVTVNVYVQSDSWAKPVKLTHKVSVTTKKPTLKAVNSTLKLNSYFPSETASSGLILSQGNLSLSTVELTPTAKAGAAATESEKLGVSYDLDSEEIVAEILDSSIKNGTYSFACVGTLEDGTAISGGTVKVSVTNTLPKAKLSAFTVKLNKRLTGEEATVKVTLTGGNGYTVTGFENLPDFMWYEDGILTVTLPEQSGTYPLYATVSRGGEEAVLPTAVKLTVQVYDKVPSFRLSAKGKLDVLNPDSEIIYTPKLTNALGTATDVELTGASADLFDAEVVNGTIHLTLAKSGDNYSTKATYKIVPLLTICDQQVKGPALSIKVTQSALKLASLPNRTVYTSQATPLLQTLHVTAPAAAEIGDVTLNAKTSAALRSALDTAGELQSRGATIAFPAKAFTGLKPGNYTVILDIIPVNAASDSKPTQAKFTLTVKK